MADVYGFNEAKSKVQVVDKATQDATDASQNTAIANKAISSVGASVDDSNNLTITVKQADGTSKSGSVALPAGGEIPVEQYGTKAVTGNLISRTVTFGSSISFSCTSMLSSADYHRKSSGANDTIETDGLYLDTDTNTLKRCIKTEMAHDYSSTVSGRYSASTVDSGTTLTVIQNAFSFLKGLYLIDSNNPFVYYIIGSSCIFQLICTLDSSQKITAIDRVWCIKIGSSSGTVTLNGNYTATLSLEDGTSGRIGENLGSMPSTYRQILDLTA